jgi:hypothetical protein
MRGSIPGKRDDSFPKRQNRFPEQQNRFPEQQNSFPEQNDRFIKQSKRLQKQEYLFIKQDNIFVLTDILFILLDENLPIQEESFRKGLFRLMLQTFWVVRQSMGTLQAANDVRIWRFAGSFGGTRRRGSFDQILAKRRISCRESVG